MMYETEVTTRAIVPMTENESRQKTQLERQAEALALQKEQFQLVQKQYEKAAKDKELPVVRAGRLP